MVVEDGRRLRGGGREDEGSAPGESLSARNGRLDETQRG